MKLIFISLLCAGLFPLELKADLKQELKASIIIQNKGKTFHKTESAFLVFISLGMLDEVLLSLANDAEGVGGLFVIRGLPNNSFKDFAKRMLQLKEKGLAAPIQIDPALFHKYGVTCVPTFVLKTDEAKFDKVSGNVSIEYVLELFKHNECGKEADA